MRKRSGDVMVKKKAFKLAAFSDVSHHHMAHQMLSGLYSAGHVHALYLCFVRLGSRNGASGRETLSRHCIVASRTMKCQDMPV